VKAPRSFFVSLQTAGMLFMLRRLNAPSMAATALNAQHDPHCPCRTAASEQLRNTAVEQGISGRIMQRLVSCLVFDTGDDVLVDPVELRGSSRSILGAVRADGGGLALGHGAQHVLFVFAVAEVGHAIDREEKRFFAAEIRSVVGVDFGDVRLPVGHVMSAKFCRRVRLAVLQGPGLKCRGAIVVIRNGMMRSNRGGHKGSEKKAGQKLHGKAAATIGSAP
jgi:hypothetical protein